ncbi:MAG: hypothetical protein H6667_24350 [Ardenticatenaceae bacterium]|nr:hypothetical protein [Ardenticatenaceae bacterium]
MNNQLRANLPVRIVGRVTVNPPRGRRDRIDGHPGRVFAGEVTFDRYGW